MIYDSTYEVDSSFNTLGNGIASSVVFWANFSTGLAFIYDLNDLDAAE